MGSGGGGGKSSERKTVNHYVPDLFRLCWSNIQTGIRDHGNCQGVHFRSFAIAGGDVEFFCFCIVGPDAVGRVGGLQHSVVPCVHEECIALIDTLRRLSKVKYIAVLLAGDRFEVPDLPVAVKQHCSRDLRADCGLFGGISVKEPLDGTGITPRQYGQRVPGFQGINAPLNGFEGGFQCAMPGIITCWGYKKFFTPKGDCPRENKQ